MYYFISKYTGVSDNDSEDTHVTLWIPYDNVYEILSYESLKNVWESVKSKVQYYFDKLKV